MNIKELACTAAEWFATPIAILAIPAICGAWLLFGHMAALTLALSIMAITMTQLVLLANRAREERADQRDVAMHAKLDELLHAIDGARDEVAGIEPD